METTTIIPAEPGYQTISLQQNAEILWPMAWPSGTWRSLLFAQPVIAWAVSISKDADGSWQSISTVAVTPRLNLSPETEHVLAPDGRVFDGEDVYDDLNAWALERFDHMRKLAEVRKSVEEQMAKVKKP